MFWMFIHVVGCIIIPFMAEQYSILCIEGVQNRPPQDVVLWHVNYCELKAVNTLWTHEKILPLS